MLGVWALWEWQIYVRCFVTSWSISYEDFVQVLLVCDDNETHNHPGERREQNATDLGTKLELR